MSAEWCEHEPPVRYIDKDGQRAVVHVLVAVPDTAGCQRAYRDWKHERDLLVSGDGAIVATGPACPFRIWAVVNHPPPKRTFGNPDAEYAARERVSIPIDL